MTVAMRVVRFFEGLGLIKHERRTASRSHDALYKEMGRRMREQPFPDTLDEYSGSRSGPLAHKQR